VYNLLFRPSPQEDTAGHVLPVLANMKRRSIVMTCAILLHRLDAGQMHRRPGDGDVPAKIGRKLNARRIFQSSISICGLSDILGRNSLIL